MNSSLYDGILVVDKEKSWTSHDVCAFVRSRFGIKKVGHAGTLDPLATGVLVVLLGRATKRSQELASCDKEYLGTMELGFETDTHDISGRILARKEWKHITEREIEASIQKFTGVLEQTPPMVSALKHKGVRLYRLARAGKTVDRPSRIVTVHELRIERIELPHIHFFARVSKGTYLRTLVNDLGHVMGSCAVLSDLRRTRSGSFALSDAVTIPELKRMNADDLLNLIKEPQTVSVRG